MQNNKVNSFMQDKNNFITKLSINVLEGLIGFTKAITTPDDRVHEIKKVGASQDKEKLTLKGCGLPYTANGREKFGDLIVFCRIEPAPPGFFECISPQYGKSALPPASPIPEFADIEEAQISFIGRVENDSIEDFLNTRTPDEVEYERYFNNNKYQIN